MFSGTLNSIARERASFLRDAEYIKENVKDSALQEAILIYEACDKDHKLVTEDNIVSPEEKEEIKRAIAQIPTDSDSSEEIDRIMSAHGSAVSIDDIMGIKSDETGDTVYSDMINDLNEVIKAK